MRKKTLYSALGSAFTGAANGLFGGGGGMIAVPFLERALSYPAPKAHATAIAVVLPATIVSGIVYLLCGALSLNVLIPVTLGAVIGGMLGAKLLKGAPKALTQILFAFLMLIAGIRMMLG